MDVKTYRKKEKQEIIETNISNNKEILKENLDYLKKDYNNKKMEKLRKSLRQNSVKANKKKINKKMSKSTSNKTKK